MIINESRINEASFTVNGCTFSCGRGKYFVTKGNSKKEEITWKEYQKARKFYDDLLPPEESHDPVEFDREDDAKEYYRFKGQDVDYDDSTMTVSNVREMIPNDIPEFTEEDQMVVEANLRNYLKSKLNSSGIYEDGRVSDKAVKEIKKFAFKNNIEVPLRSDRYSGDDQDHFKFDRKLIRRKK